MHCCPWQRLAKIWCSRGYHKECYNTGMFCFLPTQADTGLRPCAFCLCRAAAPMGCSRVWKSKQEGKESCPGAEQGTKQSLYLIPCSDLLDIKTFASLFSYLDVPLPALKTNLNFFKSSPAFIDLIWCFLQAAICSVSPDQFIPVWIVIVHSSCLLSQ